MPLALTVDKLDTVPEAQRALYVEKEGKFHLDVDGLEDTSGLKSALQKERDAAKAAEKARKEIETKFQGIDPEVYRQTMSKFENDEEAKLIRDGKMEEVVQRRTEKFRQESEKQIAIAKANEGKAGERAKKFEQRVLDNQIRQAATVAGVHKDAIDDALFRSRTIFSLSEDGEAVQIGADGHPVIGKDGKTPFSPVEWLEGMKEKAPHWFPAGSSGGGSQGSGGGAGGAKTMKRPVFLALSPEAQNAFLQTDKGKVID